MYLDILGTSWGAIIATECSSYIWQLLLCLAAPTITLSLPEATAAHHRMLDSPGIVVPNPAVRQTCYLSCFLLKLKHSGAPTVPSGETFFFILCKVIFCIHKIIRYKFKHVSEDFIHLNCYVLLHMMNILCLQDNTVLRACFHYLTCNKGCRGLLQPHLQVT